MSDSLVKLSKITIRYKIGCTDEVKERTINVQNYFQLISSYKIPMQKEKTLTQILV